MCSFISLSCCGRMKCSTLNRFSFSTIQVKCWEQSSSKNIVYCTKKHAFSNTYECYYYSRFDMDSIRGWKMMKMAHIFRFHSHIVGEKKIRNHFSVTKYKMRLRTMTCLLYILDLFHRFKVAFFATVLHSQLHRMRTEYQKSDEKWMNRHLLQTRTWDRFLSFLFRWFDGVVTAKGNHVDDDGMNILVSYPPMMLKMARVHTFCRDFLSRYYLIMIMVK